MKLIEDEMSQRRCKKVVITKLTDKGFKIANLVLKTKTCWKPNKPRKIHKKRKFKSVLLPIAKFHSEIMNHECRVVELGLYKMEYNELLF
jgi:hypothetical protein